MKAEIMEGVKVAIARKRHAKQMSATIFNVQSCYMTGGSPPISSSWRQAFETHDQYFFFN
jgi:hypothetical protein